MPRADVERSARVLRLFRAEHETLRYLANYLTAAEAEARRARGALEEAGGEPQYASLERRLTALGNQVAAAYEVLGVARGIRSYMSEQFRP